MKKTVKSLALVAVLILGACAKAPMSGQKTQFQSNTNKVLGAYAASVSRGFKSTKSSSSKRGAFYDTYGLPTYTSSQWQQQNYQYGGNVVIKQALAEEAEECVKLSEGIPENCANLPFMVSSLSRCLDRIVTYRNPVFTHAYRNMDSQGQQYWAYLLDWRRPQSIQDFGLSNFSQMSGYASSGYVDSDIFDY